MPYGHERHFFHSHWEYFFGESTTLDLISQSGALDLSATATLPKAILGDFAYLYELPYPQFAYLQFAYLTILLPTCIY